MKNLKNYISLNLLSLLGISFLIFCVLTILVLFPYVRQFDFSHNNFDLDAQYGLFNWAYRIFILTLVSELILLVFAVVEFVNKKLNKNSIKITINMPERLKKIYSVLFYFGMVMALLPILLFIITLF